MDFQTYQNLFNNYLKDYLKDNPHKDAIEYMTKNGKRLRPILTLISSFHINPKWEDKHKDQISKIAIMIELLHSSSLLIDDLPTIDNDLERRNQMTFHCKYGRHKTYLMVYNILAEIKRLIIEITKEIPKNHQHEFEKYINTESDNLLQGQKYDLNPDWIPTDKRSRCLVIADLKTASLFRTALVLPWFVLSNLYSDNNNEDLLIKKKLYDLGTNLGIAFQLSDDYLDFYTDDPVKNNNYGFETSLKELKRKGLEYLDLAKQSNIDSKTLQEIINLIEKRFMTDPVPKESKKLINKIKSLKDLENKYKIEEILLKKYGDDVKTFYQENKNALFELEDKTNQIWGLFISLWSIETQSLIIKILELISLTEREGLKIKKHIFEISKKYPQQYQKDCVFWNNLVPKYDYGIYKINMGHDIKLNQIEKWVNKQKKRVLKDLGSFLEKSSS